MMPKTIPTIATDKGMQEDAMRYAQQRAPKVLAVEVKYALDKAYRAGAVSAFATGYRLGYSSAEPEYKDSIKFYKDALRRLAADCYDIALRRGKIATVNTHSEIVEGIASEMQEFIHATDAPSEHLPDYTARQEELVDIIICCLTELHREHVNPLTLLECKTEFNRQRMQMNERLLKGGAE